MEKFKNAIIAFFFSLVLMIGCQLEIFQAYTIFFLLWAVVNSEELLDRIKKNG